VQHIDHVGVAVKDIEAAIKFFEKTFGIKPSPVTVLEDQGVKATLLAVGQTRLELLEPLKPETTVGRFIERRGEGLHHLAFNVSDVAKGLEEVKGQGLEVIDKAPREGLSGMIAFLHPRSTFGVLTELVQSIE
jgi:methylmalonyl-CoA/ethylmalonyl-CoA epimerase